MAIKRPHMNHTINLNVDKSRNKKKLTTINDHIGSNALIKKHIFRIKDFAVSYPQIVAYYLMMPQHATVTEAEQSSTGTVLICWHALVLDTSQRLKCNFSYWHIQEHLHTANSYNTAQ